MLCHRIKSNCLRISNQNDSCIPCFSLNVFNKPALEELEQAYLAYQAARLDPQAGQQHVEGLLKTFKEKQRAASQFVKKNEFGDIIEREGGVALNAFTSADVTGYFYALPSNKVELFAYLESERFLHPVFREFYEERDVVMEERRMRTGRSTKIEPAIKPYFEPCPK